MIHVDAQQRGPHAWPRKQLMNRPWLSTKCGDYNVRYSRANSMWPISWIQVRMAFENLDSTLCQAYTHTLPCEKMLKEYKKLVPSYLSDSASLLKDRFPRARGGVHSWQVEHSASQQTSCPIRGSHMILHKLTLLLHVSEPSHAFHWLQSHYLTPSPPSSSSLRHRGS